MARFRGSKPWRSLGEAPGLRALRRRLAADPAWLGVGGKLRESR